MISVIIPAYNAALTITDTINSVIEQDYKNYEIIVINDGSTDNTLEVLQSMGINMTIMSTENKGVSHARNLGLSLAKGQYIQYLDADDLLLPHKFQIQVEALKKNHADVAYGNFKKFRIINNSIHITEKVNRKLVKDPEIEIFRNFWCPPAVLLYTKDLADKIRWNENLPVIQDARYLLDAAMLNSTFIYCDSFLALYREGQQNSLSKRSEKAFVLDCFINSKEIFELWKSEIPFNLEKEKALIEVLRYCINRFSVLDKKLFYEAVEYLLKIKPNYVPPEKGMLNLLTKLFGYLKAEEIASIKRKLVG